MRAGWIKHGLDVDEIILLAARGVAIIALFNIVMKAVGSRRLTVGSTMR